MKVKGILWFSPGWGDAWFEGDDGYSYAFQQETNKWVKLIDGARQNTITQSKSVRWFRAEILTDDPNICQRVGKWFKATLTSCKGKS